MHMYEIFFKILWGLKIREGFESHLTLLDGSGLF